MRQNLDCARRLQQREVGRIQTPGAVGAEAVQQAGGTSAGVALFGHRSSVRGMVTEKRIGR